MPVSSWQLRVSQPSDGMHRQWVTALQGTVTFHVNGVHGGIQPLRTLFGQRLSQPPLTNCDELLTPRPCQGDAQLRALCSTL